jgi:DNA-binding PadR family transcriptional regulator
LALALKNDLIPCITKHSTVDEAPRQVDDAERETIRNIVTNFSRGIILWLVNEKPMSGYSLVKELERLTGQHLPSGIVYPLLYEMEKDGFIAGEWTEKGRRRTKYYAITPSGVESLDRLRALFNMPVKEALRDFISKN